MSKITEEQYDELLEIMDETWCEEEEVLDALIAFIGDYEEIKDVLYRDRHFNRYTCDVLSWTDLAQRITEDEAFEEDEDQSYICMLLCLLESKDEKAIEKHLREQNWCISVDHNVAIGFDDDVSLKRMYVNDDNF